MSRVKGGPSTRRRRAKVLSLAKGFRGSASKHYRAAHEFVMRSLAYSYRDRRNRKRDFRALWIARINAAARESGISYGRMMSGLKKADVLLNRKMLAELAVRDRAVFDHLVEEARKSA